MIELLEKRRLFHGVFVQNGILNFPGEDQADDILSVTIVGDSYHTTANDGFTLDTPIADVTVGINVNGGGGNDQIDIGPGITLPVTLVGAAGNDTLNGGAEKDTIFGGDGDDVILGNGGRDALYGDRGNDTLSGGTKNDTLNGGDGADSMVGSAGTLDQVVYFDKNNRVDVSLDGLANDGEAGEGDTITDTCEAFVGGTAGDFIRGSGKANLIYGGEGNDTLIGGSGNDTIFGDDGNDSLDGQAGNDALVTRGDNLIDTLSGGSGSDSADKDANDIATFIP